MSSAAIAVSNSTAQHGGNLPSQDSYPQTAASAARDRSGRKADAVRDRTFHASRAPGPDGSIDLVRVDLAPLSLSPLTPARWDAKRWRSQFSAPFGSGVAVTDVTTAKPACNSQSFDIAALFVRLQRLRDLASRHARGGVCEHLRVYARGEKLVTLKPLWIYEHIHRFTGYKLVAKRLQLVTSLRLGLGTGGVLRFPIKIGVGYPAPASIDAADRLRSTVARGRVAQTFGLGRAGRVGAGLELGLGLVDGAAGRNGGFLPFLVRASGRVGRVLLEGWPERLGFALVSGARPLPSRPVRGAAGRPGQGDGLDQGARRVPAEAPPCPPSLASRASSMIAREGSGISTGLLHAGDRHCPGEDRKISTGNTGSGWKAANLFGHNGVGERRGRACAMGWAGCVEAGHVRRGDAHVNRA